MNEEVPKAPAPEEETPAAPVGGEVPDWLRQLKPADVELEPPVALESSVAPGPEAEAGGLTEKEVAEAWRKYFIKADRFSADRMREIIAQNEEMVAASEGQIQKFYSSFDNRAKMPVDAYLQRLRQILAEKEEAEAAAAEAEDRGKDAPSLVAPEGGESRDEGAERVDEAPPEPVAVSFAAKVRAARGLVAGAVREAGGLPDKIAGDLGVADEMRRTDRKTDLSIEEIPEEELRKARGTLVKLRASDSHLKFLDDSIALQEQYRLGAEMAAAVEESMRAAVKELKPGWFEREPAMVREMAELQAFFNQSGDEANLREQIANLEEAKTNILWNFLNGTQKQTVESELLLAKNKLAALESVDRFMGREDMPRILRKVIDAARAGKEYSFGTGPVDNFRRRVYESVISTLGIETEPAVEVSPAIAPAAAPAPEPKPEPAAPVETAEQIRQRAEKEFLGEDELDPVVSQAQAKLRESILRGKSDPEAVALVLEKRVEQNPGASGAVVAGVKQLAMDVLEEARRERDPRKRQKMLTWVKDFGVGLEATAMVGSISLNALDALISAIVSELGGQK